MLAGRSVHIEERMTAAVLVAVAVVDADAANVRFDPQD